MGLFEESGFGASLFMGGHVTYIACRIGIYRISSMLVLDLFFWGAYDFRFSREMVVKTALQ